MSVYRGFIGGMYQSQSVIGDQELTMNLYVENMESEGAKSGQCLLSTPGFQVFVNSASGITDVSGRGFWSDIVSGTERCFAVIGLGLYEVFANKTVIKRGTLAQDSNLATISYNGIGGHLFITSGSNGYNYVLATNVLTQVLTGDATMGAFAHGYFLAFNVMTGRVRESALNDGTNWDPSQFFQRSLLSDPWQAMFVDGNSLVWLPGTDSFEVWYDTGTGTQPFAPLSGLVGPYGIASPFAFANDTNVTWLTKNKRGAGQVVSFKGSPDSVSTYAIANTIAGYQRTSTIADAEALVYQDAGHTSVNWAFPTANATWSFDVDKPSWTGRGAWNAPLGRYDIWAPRVHGYAFGKHLVGLRTSGTIAEMSAAFATEPDGVTGIRRLRRAPGITIEHQRMPYDRLELLMDMGLGTVTGQGSDPKIMLRVSGDGGRTWGNERLAGIGAIGNYRKRAYWNRLGSLRDAVFEVTCSEPVPLRIVQAWLNNMEQAA